MGNIAFQQASPLSVYAVFQSQGPGTEITVQCSEDWWTVVYVDGGCYCETGVVC
jgi:hypothetical protein